MAFIVFEGVDGSGKSSLIQDFLKELKKRELSFVQSKEPGGSLIGQKIRKLLLDRNNNTLNPLAETLLYYADRAQHIQDVIAPALEKKKWVILDRYWASTSAYQCGGRRISESFVWSLMKEVCKKHQPDLWVLLDLSLEISLKRLNHSSSKKIDRMEQEKPDFHQRVKNYYLKLAQQEPEKWLILNSSEKPSQLLKQLISQLEKKAFL